MPRRILTNIIYQFADRLLTMIMNFTLVLILTHSLSLQTFGEYTFVQAYIFGFITFTDLGVNVIVLRELSAHKYPGQWVIERTFTLKLAIAFCIFVAAVTSVLLFGYSPQVTGALLIYACILLLTPLDVILSWFQSELKGRVIAWTDSLSLALSFGLSILVVIFLSGNLFGLASVLLTQSLFRYFIFYRSFHKQGMRLRLTFDWKYSWFVIRHALPLTLTSLLTSFCTNAALVLLSKANNPEELAFYSAGSRFNTILLFMPQAVVLAVFPIMVNYHNQPDALSRTKLNNLYSKLVFYMTLVAVLLGVVTVFFGSPIMGLVFGSKYIAGATVLKIMIWYVAIVYLGIPVGALQAAMEKQVAIAIAQAVGAISLLALSFVLVPQYKSAGLAIVMVSSLGLTLFLQFVHVRFFLKIKTLGILDFRLPVLIALLTGICWLTSTLPVLLAVPICLLFYAGGILLLRLVTVQDLVFLRSNFTRKFKQPEVVTVAPDISESIVLVENIAEEYPLIYKE